MNTDWITGVPNPAQAKEFSSSRCVQTDSAAHPASYPMGTGGPFLGIKRGRGVTLRKNPKRSLERRSRGWKNNIKTNLKESV
jgi:hypothetical protein